MKARGIFKGNSLRAFVIFSVLSALAGLSVSAQDRLAIRDTIPGPDFIITPRVNSAGHFPFTGSLINKHVNADLNVFYEKGNYGFFVFKSHDLEERRSIVNYLQPGIFRKIPVAPKFYMRLFVGYLFSQAASFRDNDSDYYAAVVGYWTLADNLTVENTALFFDLVKSTKLANRFLMSWSSPGRAPFRVDVYVWHRWVFEQSLHATSASLAVSLPKIRISPAASILTTLSYQGYLSESKPDYARRDGFLFSIAIPLVLSSRTK